MMMLEKRKNILFVLFVFIHQFAFSQTFSALLNSNNCGISAISINPASIANNNRMFDMSIGEASGSIQNNIAGFNKRIFNITSNGLEFDSTQSPLIIPNINKGRFAAAGNIALFSFMFQTKSQKAFGISFRLRSINNVSFRGLDSLTTNLYNSIFTENIVEPETVIFDKIRKLKNGNIQAKSMIWTEIGFSYGKVLYNKNNQLIKFGTTLKLLNGISGGYFNLYSNDISIDNNGEITSAAYDNAISLRPSFLASTSLGLDGGLIYEYTDTTKAYLKNQYDLKLGFSVLDLGRVRFQNNKTPILESPINNRDQSIKNFTMGLPTSIALQIDYRLKRNFLINATTQIGLFYWQKRTTFPLTTITIAPRIEKRFGEFTIPIQITQFNKVDVGLGFRLGPIWFGSSTLITLLAKKEIYGADGMFILKLPLFKKADNPFSIPKLKENFARVQMKYMNQQHYSKRFSESRLAPKNHLFKISGIGLLIEQLNIEYEQKIRQLFSMLVGVTIPDVYFKSGYDTYSIHTQGRYYYNLVKRMEKQKTGDNFSANYFASGLSFDAYAFPTSAGSNVYARLPVVYGIQRTFWKYGYFDINAGIIAGQIPEYIFDITGSVRLGVAF